MQQYAVPYYAFGPYMSMAVKSRIGIACTNGTALRSFRNRPDRLAGLHRLLLPSLYICGTVDDSWPSKTTFLDLIEHSTQVSNPEWVTRSINDTVSCFENPSPPEIKT
jgi:hypothetical protein